MPVGVAVAVVGLGAGDGVGDEGVGVAVEVVQGLQDGFVEGGASRRGLVQPCAPYRVRE